MTSKLRYPRDTLRHTLVWGGLDLECEGQEGAQDSRVSEAEGLITVGIIDDLFHLFQYSNMIQESYHKNYL